MPALTKIVGFESGGLSELGIKGALTMLFVRTLIQDHDRSVVDTMFDSLVLRDLYLLSAGIVVCPRISVETL